MIVIGLIIAIVVLAIYAVIITYLYRKQKKEKDRIVEKGKVDIKIEEIRERLNEVESIRYPKKIDIEEEKER